jgi:lipid-A-disaccharide synthase
MRIALVAGEPSGDYLGGGLIRALATRFPDACFEGIGGPQMQAAGLHSHYPLEALSVMGLVEVIQHLPRLLAIRRHLRRRWLEQPPDLFIGIDAPDFNLGLARQLRAAEVSTVQYVSPTIWAWREGRIKRIRHSVDHVLCLFPFEVSFYHRHGMPASFVGHPLADDIPQRPDQQTARSTLGESRDGPLIALLPGSRSGEVARLLPLFLDVAARLLAGDQRRRFLIPAATPALTERIKAHLAGHQVAPACRVVAGHSRTCLAAAQAAILASGTATLEAMLSGCPGVVAYRVNPFTAMLARQSLRVSHFALPNLLSGHEVMPEFIQNEAQPGMVAEAAARLLENPAAAEAMLTAFGQQHDRLRQRASATAAAVLDREVLSR